MKRNRDQQIISAYACIFTVALGIVADDLQHRRSMPQLADLPPPGFAPQLPSVPAAPPAGAAHLTSNQAVIPFELPPRSEPLRTADLLHPAPVPVANVPSVPKHPRIAPAGFAYLKSRVSLVSDSGIASVAPGTRVKIVSRSAQRIKVNDGMRTFEVMLSQLTNDVELAERLAAQAPASLSLAQH